MDGKRRGTRSATRQKVFNRIILVSVMIVVIAITAYAFTRTTSVALPDYLNRCISPTAKLVYKSEPHLVLNVSGSLVPIPQGIGIIGSCLRPMSTVDTSGVIHIISDVDRDYTLGDFFTMWGNSQGPTFANFNQYQLFNFRADGQTHTISMNVNSNPNYDFQNYVFPRNTNYSYHFNLIVIYYS